MSYQRGIDSACRTDVLLANSLFEKIMPALKSMRGGITFYKELWKTLLEYKSGGPEFKPLLERPMVGMMSEKCLGGQFIWSPGLLETLF